MFYDGGLGVYESRERLHGGTETGSTRETGLPGDERMGGKSGGVWTG